MATLVFQAQPGAESWGAEGKPGFAEHGRFWTEIRRPSSRPKNLSSRRLVPWDEFDPLEGRSDLNLVKGLLGSGGLTVLYGPSQSGKSFIALDIAAAVGAGIPWMGRKTQQGPVIYFAGEGQVGLRKRKLALAKEKYRDHNPSVHFFPYQLNGSKDLQTILDNCALVKAICDAPPVLLVFDTLNAHFGDGKDENSTQDMTNYVRLSQSIRERYGNVPNVVQVHHTGWDDSRMRGSYTLKAAADTILAFKTISVGPSCRGQQPKGGDPVSHCSRGGYAEVAGIAAVTLMPAL